MQVSNAVYRQLLCVVLDQVEPGLQASLSEAGWKVYQVADYVSAARVLREQEFRVGLLVLSSVEEADWLQAGHFMHLHGEVEWLVVLSAEALAASACVDAVLGSAFDHHRLPWTCRGCS